MSAIPDELKRLYKEGRLVPFVGAGFTRSASENAPSWGELVDEAARQLGYAYPELARVRGTDLQILEYYGLKQPNLFTSLRDWLKSAVHIEDEALSQSVVHRALVELSECKLLYTTNYDDYVERSYRLADKSTRVIATEKDMTSEDVDVEIVKFHGDLKYPETMVLSETQYEDRLLLNTELDHRFQSDMLNKAILFLGYSFRDPNVSYMFRLLNRRSGRLPSSDSGRRAYIIVPDPSDFETQLFLNRNITVLPVERTGIGEQTADLLRQLRE